MRKWRVKKNQDQSSLKLTGCVLDPSAVCGLEGMTLQL